MKLSGLIVALALIGCGEAEMTTTVTPMLTCDINNAHLGGNGRTETITRIVDAMGNDVAGIKNYAGASAPSYTIGMTPPGLQWAPVGDITGPTAGSCSVEAMGLFDDQWSPPDPASPYKIYFTQTWPASSI